MGAFIGWKTKRMDESPDKALSLRLSRSDLRHKTIRRKPFNHSAAHANLFADIAPAGANPP
jgi:hypothetical protein